MYELIESRKKTLQDSKSFRIYVDFVFYGEILYCKFAMLAVKQSTKEVESRTFNRRKKDYPGNLSLV